MFWFYLSVRNVIDFLFVQKFRCIMLFIGFSDVFLKTSLIISVSLMFHDRSENHFNVLLLMKQVLAQLFLTTSWNLRISRSTCSEIFYKEAVLENIAKSARKHLCWSPFKINLQALKKTFSAGVFLWILRNLKKRPFTEPRRVLLLIFLEDFYFAIHLSWNCSNTRLHFFILKKY